MGDPAVLVGFDLVVNAKSNLIEAEFGKIVEGLAKVIGRFHESQLKVEKLT